MNPKFGDILYFRLLDLEKHLKYFGYDKLDLICLDKLRNEVAMKIEQIHYEENKNKQTQKDIEKVKRKFDFWCGCIVYHHAKEYSFFKVCPVCDKRIDSKIIR